MSIIRTPRTETPDTRRALVNGRGDAWSWAADPTERGNAGALRDRARAANAIVRQRNESEECVGDVDLWATYLRSTEDINEIVSFRPETGLAYIRTRGCWEGYILAANVAIKPAFGRG